MPQWKENVECFYRHQDGEMFRVNFGEELYYKGADALSATYGGDGTLQGCGQAFFESLSTIAVAAKRLVHWKPGAHETIAHNGSLWESLPAHCAEGSYTVKMHDQKIRSPWISPYNAAAAEPCAPDAEPVIGGQADRVVHQGAGSVSMEQICPMSYFGEAGPHKGDPVILAEHRGTTYSLSNQEAKEIFLAEPDKYLPQFGGYCATAISQGKLRGADCTNFKVNAEGRLLLFMKFPVDHKEIWDQDEAGGMERANTAWEQLQVPYEAPPTSVLPARTELVNRAGRPATHVGF